MDRCSPLEENLVLFLNAQIEPLGLWACHWPSVHTTYVRRRSASAGALAAQPERDANGTRPVVEIVQRDRHPRDLIPRHLGVGGIQLTGDNFPRQRVSHLIPQQRRRVQLLPALGQGSQPTVAARGSLVTIATTTFESMTTVKRFDAQARRGPRGRRPPRPPPARGAGCESWRARPGCSPGRSALAQALPQAVHPRGRLAARRNGPPHAPGARRSLGLRELPGRALP